MTRFSSFTDDELDAMEEAFCNESLKYLVFEIRREKLVRIAKPQEIEDKEITTWKKEDLKYYRTIAD